METNAKVADPSARHSASIYRVSFAGTLPRAWEDRMGSLQVVHDEGTESPGQTTLMGAVRDQADLLGVLNTLHEVGLRLLLVESLDMDSLLIRKP